jgi:DNA ligase (NAD+)
MFDDILEKVQTISSKEDFLYILNGLSDVYYNSSDSSITDTEFDTLVSIYENKFNDKYSYIGSSGKNKLPCFMPSLNKAKDQDTLNIYKKRCSSDKYIVTDKIDGYSLLIVFNKNKVKLYNRGDGEYGTDVTDIYEYINKGNIKKNLGDIKYVRGELVMDNSTFEKYKLEYNNPRNLVAGVINSKERDVNILRDIKFIAYSLPVYTSISNNEDVLHKLEELGFYVPYKKVISSDDVNVKELSSLLTKRKFEAPYDIDGLVVTPYEVHVENSVDKPKYNIAFKMLGDVKEAEVVDVEWKVSKNNLLKPRVKIVPIQFGSIKVTYLTGFNAQFINNNKVGKGAILEVTRSGDVIPHILSVIKGTTPLLPQTKCYWKGVELVADDDNTKVQFINRMITLFTQVGVKGMKEGILTKLYDSGISTEYSLFNASKDILLCVEGVKDKSADNILKCIDELNSKVTLIDLMVGSCIFQNFGDKKIRKILEGVPEVERYITTQSSFNRENLIRSISMIGGFNKTAEQFVDFLPSFIEYYNDIKNILNIKDNKREEVTVEGKYTGEVYCFSGFRDSSLKEYITNNGGKVIDAITKELTHLIVKDKGSSSSKVEKAIKYGCKIMSLDEIKNN